jgi:RNA polymerase sigma factor (sigma-70 family)
MNDYNTSITLVQKMRNLYDDSSWARFTEVYTPYIRMIILKMGMRHHDAEDLIQGIILKAWQGLPNFNYSPDKAALRSWLKTITRNTTISHLRKKCNSEHSLNAIQENSPNHLGPVTESDINQWADEEWESYITEMAWNNIKGELGENAQQTFVLLNQGKSPEEIAAKLDVKLNTVYQTRKRITERLYREIRHLDHELG